MTTPAVSGGNSGDFSLVLEGTGSETRKTATFTIKEDERDKITVDAFKQAILYNDYSTKPKAMGVSLLEDVRWLGWTGGRKDSGYHVMYQRTGGAMGVSSRHYIIGLKEDRGATDDHIRISWQLLNNYDDQSGQFTGTWGEKTGTVPTDAIWTPYNTGYWDLNIEEGTITYSINSDVGGRLLINPDSAAVSYPNHVVAALGLSGKFDI